MSTIKQRHAPNIPNIPYLTHPIKSDYKISEGYIYSNYETSVHGNYFHKGIDYACPYGTPIYAAANGYAVASYFRFTAFNKDDKSVKLYKGLPMGNGLGYFIQIYHPEEVCGIKGGRVTQYGHLSRFADGIYAKTFRWQDRDWEERLIRKNKSLRKVNRRTDEEMKILIRDIKKLIWKYPWVKKQYGFSYEKDIKKKESFLYTSSELKQLLEDGDKYVKWVEQGELIGYTGTSGIIHGRLRFKENMRRPRVREYKIWDECHLHFEECIRDWETGLKKDRRDPYGIYLSKEHYKNIKQKTLFIDEGQKRLW